MNKYDVICTIGWRHSIMHTVLASNEYDAKKIIWDSYLTDDQRNNCEDIEVFKVDEKECLDDDYRKTYYTNYDKLKKGEITMQQWMEFCTKTLNKIMTEHKDIFERLKNV